MAEVVLPVHEHQVDLSARFSQYLGNDPTRAFTLETRMLVCKVMYCLLIGGWIAKMISSYEKITTVTHKQLFIKVHVHAQKSP